MSSSALTYPRRVSSLLWRAADYVELTKPKILVLELVTVVAAAVIVGVDRWLLLHALIGTSLIASGASALNQWLECESDARMERTADRPLPAGRLGTREVVAFGVCTAFAGVLYLLLFVNGLTASIGLLSLILYVLVYTPLKMKTPANTTIGAVAGALPVLMGVTAMEQPLDLRAATLFLIVFLWQFPHFMAIAWMYRDQYAAAGHRMLTVVDPTGVRAAAQAVIVALLLVPVSLVPAVLPTSGSVWIYFAGTLLLGVGQLACAIWFFVALDERSARRLLRASLVYLPSVLTFLLLATPL